MQSTFHTREIVAVMKLINLQRRHKALLYLTGIIIPCICFLVALVAAPDWQSGRPGAYALLFLSAAGSCPFWPVLIFSMVAMHKVLFVKGASQKGLVRLGLATGVLLSAQYCIALSAVATNSWLLAVLLALGVEISLVVCLFILNLVWRKVRERFPQITLGKLTIVLMLLAFGGWCLYVGLQNVDPNCRRIDFWMLPGACLFYCLLLLIIPGPAYCLTAFIYAYIFLLEPVDVESKDIARKRKAIWAGVYAGSWSASIPLLLWRYSMLPKHPPSCYVATAAARGHTGLTGAEIENCGGKAVLITKQMRTLKCFECLMLIVTPRFHYYFRSFYNIVGPVLAEYLTHPIAADIAYLLLKPFEYTAKLILYSVVPNAQNVIKLFYRYPGEKPQEAGHLERNGKG